MTLSLLLGLEKQIQLRVGVKECELFVVQGEAFAEAKGLPPGRSQEPGCFLGNPSTLPLQQSCQAMETC